MTSERRFEQDLPDLLAQVAVGPQADYRDDIVRRTAGIRQRPAWTLPERWLPMSTATTRLALLPRTPLRVLAVAIILLIIVVGTALLVAGSRTRLPAPFGPAANGLIAYAANGDIYTVDSVSGMSTAIVRAGARQNLNPRWSRDGTRLAFEQRANGDALSGLVYVVRADGSEPIQVTPDALVGITGYDFSPDGKQLLISANLKSIPGLLIAATDGSEIHQLNVGMAATNAAWRPPNGSEILFMDDDQGDPSGGSGGIYLVSSQGGEVRTIVSDARSAGIYRGHPLWSPDGSLIAYGEWCALDCSTGKALTVDGATVQTYIVRADGSGERILPSPAGAQYQAPESWSNDGTRMLVIRGYTGSADIGRPAAVPVDGSGVGVEIPYPGGMSTAPTSAWGWAPDDSSILGTPVNSSGAFLDQVLLDPAAGTFRALPWASVSQPSWQRLGR